MAVYFLVDGGADSVKIGMSNNPKKRQASLQTGSTESLLLLGTIEGGRDVERSLHERFAEYRIRGEWFKWTPISEQIRELLGEAGFVRADRLYPMWEFQMITGVGKDDLYRANACAMHRYSLALLTPSGRVRGSVWLECQRREFVES